MKYLTDIDIARKERNRAKRNKQVVGVCSQCGRGNVLRVGTLCALCVVLNKEADKHYDTDVTFRHWYRRLCIYNIRHGRTIRGKVGAQLMERYRGKRLIDPSTEEDNREVTAQEAIEYFVELHADALKQL